MSSSDNETPSPQRMVPGFKIDPMETEPMIKSSYADLFGSQLNALTAKEQITESGFPIRNKRLLVLCKFACLFCLMYTFVCSLELMSIAFRLIGGKKANSFLNSELISNPVVGLMVGILVTVLVQSSSTSTSIVITMLASDMIKIRSAIPIVMGANVGTSITNTIVSFMQSGDREEFSRAFASATIHDLFNFLTVAVLLPVECLTHYLEWITNQLILTIDFEKPTNRTKETKPFIKQITSPLINSIVQMNSSLLESIRMDNGTDRTEDVSLLMKCCDKVPQTSSNCIQSCFSLFNYIGLSDWISGLLLLILAIFLLCICLILVVKILNSMLKGKIAVLISKYINTEYKKPWSYVVDYLALLIGCTMTILVQSSSIFTSTLTPLAGLGIISLERIYPLTLGSNIGTTTTGLFAALTADQTRIKETLQLAFCHLCFNLTGILLFFPLPISRVPIPLARQLGKVTSRHRWFSLVYLSFSFFILPLVIFGLSLAGRLVFLLIVTPVLLLLIAIVVINLMQSYHPTMLPVGLRSWSFVPVWFRSLDPYDALVLRLAKKIPFLFICVQSEFRHDLAMTSVLAHSANSRLHILENSRNSSTAEVQSMINQSRRSSYLTADQFVRRDEHTKPRFELANTALDDSHFY